MVLKVIKKKVVVGTRISLMIVEGRVILCISSYYVHVLV